MTAVSAYPYPIEVLVPAVRADQARADLTAYLEERAGLRAGEDWTLSERRDGNAVTFAFALRSHARSLLFKVAAAALTTPNHPAVRATSGQASGSFIPAVRARLGTPGVSRPAAETPPAFEDHSFHFG